MKQKKKKNWDKWKKYQEYLTKKAWKQHKEMDKEFDRRVLTSL